jgi:hypothetical protein
MKLTTRLATNVIVAGGMIAAAVMLKKLVRSRRSEHVTPTDEAQFAGHDAPGFAAMAELDDDLTAIATESGIANVDPEPLSHVAGEGIDLDRDVAAHREIAEQRERMPRH